MGCCCQFLSGKKSNLKKENIINYQQLEAIIKPSTHNDHFFYSSHNLSFSEEYLNLFVKNSNMQPNHELIDKNINILISFIRDLRDKSSVVGLQYTVDQQRVHQYIKNQCRKQQYKYNNIVILKLEIQILLLSPTILQEIKKQQAWDYFIEIQEVYNSPNKNNRISHTSTNNEPEKRTGLIECIWVRDHLNKKIRRTSISEKINESIEINRQKMMGEQSFIQQNEMKKQGNKQKQQIEQVQFFVVCSKIVNKNSKICISFCKDKRKKLEMKQNVNSVESKQTKVIIGQTNLQVIDFIYHNSLTVSDLVNLNSPQSMKSSSSTSSTQKSHIGVFLALRGQGLQAQTLDKDYIKIIKQHQTVVRQLQLCLEGQKAWQKLSQYKNSNPSQRGGESLYSDYESAMGMAQYKP